MLEYVAIEGRRIQYLAIILYTHQTMSTSSPRHSDIISSLPHPQHFPTHHRSRPVPSSPQSCSLVSQHRRFDCRPHAPSYPSPPRTSSLSTQPPPPQPQPTPKLGTPTPPVPAKPEAIAPTAAALPSSGQRPAVRKRCRHVGA